MYLNVTKLANRIANPNPKYISLALTSSFYVYIKDVPDIWFWIRP